MKEKLTVFMKRPLIHDLGVAGRKKLFKTAEIQGKKYVLNKVGTHVDFSKTPPEVLDMPPQEAEWELAFDEEIAPYLLARMEGLQSGKKGDIDKVKAFIRQLLLNQKKKTVEETYKMAQKEANKYFVDPLFPQVKIAVLEIFSKVYDTLKETV